MPNFHKPKIVDKATPIYRALLLECERRRQELGWSMWQVDEASGTQDGHYAKCLHADRPSGRQAQWKTLDLIVSALWRHGFDLRMDATCAPPLTAEAAHMKIRFAAADNDRVTRRVLMRELGRKGGIARREKYRTMSREQRLEIAARARETRRQNRLIRTQLRKQQPEARLPL